MWTRCNPAPKPLTSASDSKQPLAPSPNRQPVADEGHQRSEHKRPAIQLGNVPAPNNVADTNGQDYDLERHQSKQTPAQAWANNRRKAFPAKISISPTGH